MSFSIITTVLNGKEYIRDCIESVQKQKYLKDVEHIIVDGGSEDGTLNEIKKLQSNYKNIVLLIKKNVGIYVGINIGLKLAKNNIIGILNSDDFYKDSDIFKILELEFNKDPDVSAIHSNVKIFRRNNVNKLYRNFYSKNFFPEDYLKCDHPPHTSFFVKREIYNKFGYFDESLKIASDFEFMLRVFGKKKIKTKFINQTLVCMRSHGTSTKNLKNIIISNIEVIKSFKLNNIKINYLYLILKILKKAIQIKLW
ncbi:glycosyltransferase family 2 protein [Candidatus Pelagibacter sp.]|nr:glycosyltransferase family 2 protein [Candidatus Pelagibacter sp.]